ncbi:retropepsin-like aspartic protease [Mesobacillus subterraneus]|uniref:retropepsin-like aspartic protease n=1 Tax=Mesobacillus subterraneus TaxID=285983 RepID=UPI000A0090C9|nr:retropepsin-like aspartic protease [Mesobacillus subterraneus]
MKISFDGQLITTSLIITFRGKTLQIDDIIIDTGSSHTVISPDVLEEIGVIYENGDDIYEAYGIGGSVPFYTKVMDEIQIDKFNIKNIEIDVGILPKDHNGLLGLDILMTYNFIVDMDKLELYTSRMKAEDSVKNEVFLMQTLKRCLSCPGFVEMRHYSGCDRHLSNGF